MDTLPKVQKAIHHDDSDLKGLYRETCDIKYNIAQMQATLMKKNILLIQQIIKTGNVHCLSINERRLMRVIDDM